MKKKFYLIVFCFFVTLVLALCTACGDTDGDDGEDTPEQPETCIFNYGQKTQTTVIIYGIKENVSDSVLNIPQVIDGKTVIEIGRCAFNNNAYINAVKTINIPFKVDKIGYEAFKDCYNLETVNLNYGGETNSNLEEIGYGAFANCSSLKIINGSTLMLKNIGYKAFENCQNLVSTDLDDSTVLSEIGFNAFQNCSKLSSFNLPETITRIEDFAFRNSGINSAYIAENAIISYPFVGCKNLETITVNEKNELNTVIDNVLYSCGNGSEILLCYPNKRSTLDSIITSFTVPDNINGIAEYAFLGNSHLHSIDLNNVRYIREKAFENCTALQNVCGNYVDLVLDDAFFGTPWLTENTADFIAVGTALIKYNGTAINVDLSEYDTVSAYAFYDNDIIETVNLGDHMSNVGSFAFASCTNLHTVYVSNINNIIYIGQSVFDAVNENLVIYVAARLIETYKQNILWSDYIDNINIHITVVTLYKNNGEDESTVNIAYGANSALSIPTRSGFTFLGWYTQDGTNGNWGEKISPSTVWESFADTTKLYAKWIKN